ncbi:MAG TPA: PEP-CTERM sorting domain-containing protein, partial [Terriglobales bacterium]|nr:PEP-CTERM sorting domain-containing protein [Terriglobales bacterium]
HHTWLFNNILYLSSPHLDNLGLGLFIDGIDGNLYYLEENSGYWIGWGNEIGHATDLGPIDLQVNAVPEPGGLLLLSSGVSGLLGLLRRRRGWRRAV